jgi:ketosteroid isomerase-like protein
MPQQSVDLIRGLYDSFGKGDVPALLGQLDQQIEWNEAENFIYADRNPYVGPQAVLEGVFMRIGADWEGFKVAPEEWLDAGNQVVVLGTYTGRHRETGSEVRAQFAHVWGIRNGRVVRFQQYTDTKQFADAVAWKPQQRAASEV